MKHKDKRYPLYKYLGTRALTLYQAMQKYEHAPGGLIIGFYGHKPGYGLLLGVWRVVAVMPVVDAYDKGLLTESFEPENRGWKGYYHELQETDLLSDLRLKLEMSFGKGDIVWRRVLKPKDDYPLSMNTGPAVAFDGLQNVSLVMAQLRIALQDVQWQQGLGATAGVYLITDERSGRQYIGSASGAQGLLQRWKDYASTGHGGNLELIKLLTNAPGRENDLRFTLLEAIPITAPRQQLIERESYWKVALGSRVFGLNSN